MIIEHALFPGQISGQEGTESFSSPSLHPVPIQRHRIKEEGFERSRGVPKVSPGGQGPSFHVDERGIVTQQRNGISGETLPTPPRGNIRQTDVASVRGYGHA